MEIEGTIRHRDQGKGSLNAIIATLVVAAVIYAGIKIVPAYIHNYELQDFLRDLAVQATVQRTSAEQIQNAVVAKAQDLGLPVTRDNVKVTAGNKVTIDLDYTVPIDLRVATLPLHFTPSAVNRNII